MTKIMNVDTSAYDAAQPIQIPGLESAFWGILKTGQGLSVIVAAGVLMGLGVALWLSGDNTGRKTWIIGAMVALVAGEILIWFAPIIAVTLAQFAGAK